MALYAKSPDGVVKSSDVWSKVAKALLPILGGSILFGILFAVICTYNGFFTKGGAKGVGEATNRGVVVSMVGIIILDYFLMNFVRIYYLAVGISQ